MGFYRPATLVKDAQRHGLKVLPVDVTKSEWNCTLEAVSGFRFPVSSELIPGQQPTTDDQRPNWKPETGNSKLALRLGLRYARGLREEAARALLRQRYLVPFTSIRDLAHRVPELRKTEWNTLAEIGALNAVSSFQFPVSSKQGKASLFCHSDPERSEGEESAFPWKLVTANRKFNRRDALWQVERAVRHAGPLLDELPEPDFPSPLRPMSAEERLVADFRGMGLTVGSHPMAYHRSRMHALGVRRASELSLVPNGQHVRIAGCVIARQRPGTAKGFVFLSLEDETGVANAILRPEVFEKNRLLVSSAQFLLVEGILQNQDNVISVRAEHVAALTITRAPTTSHDFY